MKWWGRDTKDFSGQGQDRITNRIPVNKALFKLLSWNNAVAFRDQHRLELRVLSGQGYSPQADWMFMSKSGR